MKDALHHPCSPLFIYQQHHRKAVFCCSSAGIWRIKSRGGRGREKLKGRREHGAEEEKKGMNREGSRGQMMRGEEEETWRIVDELHRAGQQPGPFNEQSAAPNTSHLITHTHPLSLANAHTLAGALFLPSPLCSIPPSSTKYSLSRSNKQHTVTSIQMSLFFSLYPLLSLSSQPLSSFPCSNPLLFLSSHSLSLLNPSLSLSDLPHSHRGEYISPH